VISFQQLVSMGSIAHNLRGHKAWARGCSGQRHVPRELCVPSGIAWAPAFRPFRPASRACRTGRPCPGRQVRNVPVPHPSGLVGIRDGPPRVARRKCRRNTDAGDFDRVVKKVFWAFDPRFLVCYDYYLVLTSKMGAHRVGQADRDRHGS
jgi:hypothetical protein